MNIFSNRNSDIKIYSVSDFYLASFLKAKGFKLSNIDRLGRKVTFIFEDREDREQLVKDFYNDGLVQVNPFVHAIQDLKSIIYNMPKETSLASS